MINETMIIAFCIGLIYGFLATVVALNNSIENEGATPRAVLSGFFFPLYFLWLFGRWVSKRIFRL